MNELKPYNIIPEIALAENTEEKFREWSGKNPAAALLVNLFKKHTLSESWKVTPGYGLSKLVWGEVPTDHSSLLAILDCDFTRNSIALAVHESELSRKNSPYGLINLTTNYSNTSHQEDYQIPIEGIKLWVVQTKYWLPVQVSQFNWIMDFLKEINQESSKIPRLSVTDLNRGF